MLKKSFFTLVILFAFGMSMQAQQAIKIGPFGFLLGNYNLRYEKALNEKGSFQVGANFYDYKLFDVKSTVLV
ncbi:MAG: hypothetical protein H6567_04640 [Lewinellaceae bacterium]|nr:hypothetical protein [Lewinellaceae bacterium]